MAVDNKPESADLLKKADQLRLAGSYDQARVILEQLIKLNPFFAPAKLGLGRVFFESGDLANARAVLEEFAEFIPDHSLANKILAKIYIYFSQPEKARDKINMVLSASPDDSMAKRMLQEIEEVRSSQAQDLGNEDTKKNAPPTNTATIAEIYRNQGHLKEALAIYRDLSKQNTANEVYQQKVLELENQISEALTKDTAELAPEAPVQEPENSFPEFRRVEVTDERTIVPMPETFLNETVELEPGYNQPEPLAFDAEEPPQVQSEQVQSAPAGKTRQEKLERMLYLVQQHRRGANV